MGRAIAISRGQLLLGGARPQAGLCLLQTRRRLLPRVARRSQGALARRVGCRSRAPAGSCENAGRTSAALPRFAIYSGRALLARPPRGRRRHTRAGTQLLRKTAATLRPELF